MVDALWLALVIAVTTIMAGAVMAVLSTVVIAPGLLIYELANLWRWIWKT